MRRPALHIQNIYDALHPRGIGVNGYLKLKALQAENRVVALADPGDIVAVNADCPQEFLDYLLNIKQTPDVLVLRYKVSHDLNRRISARSALKALMKNPQWEFVRKRDPVINPYIQTAAIYEAARDAGIDIPERAWDTVVNRRIVETMNDKAVLYGECEKRHIPVPKHWISKGNELIAKVVALLKEGNGPLYIRKTRSAGAYGNIAVEMINSRYFIHELGARALGYLDFVRALEDFAKTSLGREFVVAELLDLYASPGTLFYADDKEVIIICHSDQILERRRRFLGFIYPITDKLIRKHFSLIEESVYRLIEPWRDMGFRGYGNIDWMVTKDGKSYIAELNARQTAVVPALKIENKLSGIDRGAPPVLSPRMPVLTIDRLSVDKFNTFEQAHMQLRKRGLLFGQHGSDRGVVILIPPLPSFDINTIGIMATGSNLATTHDIYRRSLHALGSREEELLFRLSA